MLSVGVLLGLTEIWLHFALHCHAVNKGLCQVLQERKRLWKSQHFALQSALPYWPKIQKETRAAAGGGLFLQCVVAQARGGLWSRPFTFWHVNPGRG